MKRYKIYVYHFVGSVGGGCVQEDINEPCAGSRTECTDGKTREWISDTNNEVRLLATIVNTIPTHDYIECDRIARWKRYTDCFHKGGDILIKNGLTGIKEKMAMTVPMVRMAVMEQTARMVRTVKTALTVRTEPTVKTDRTELMVPMGIMAVTDRTVPMVRMAKTELTVTTVKTA